MTWLLCRVLGLHRRLYGAGVARDLNNRPVAYLCGRCLRFIPIQRRQL